MQQQSLFGDVPAADKPRAKRGTPPHNGTATSKAGAEKAASKSGSQKALILDLLRRREEFGATNNEIQDVTGLAINVICGRIGQLKEDGVVIDSGKTRLSKANVPNKVWIATQQKGV